MLVCIVFGFVFLCIGALFFTGSALRWMKGWQAVPDEEKARIRILPLCRNLSAVMTLAGILFLLAGCWPAFLEGGFRWAMVGWMVLCGADVLYIERSGRYRSDSPAKSR